MPMTDRNGLHCDETGAALPLAGWAAHATAPTPAPAPAPGPPPSLLAAVASYIEESMPEALVRTGDRP